MAPTEINQNITLKDILKPGVDAHRWNESEGVTLKGFVSAVGRRRPNSANCLRSDLTDIYVSVVLHLVYTSDRKRRMELIITPRWQERLGIPSNFRQFRRSILHKKVSFSGWLFYDREKEKGAVNTTPTDHSNWRATAWELHPVTDYKVSAPPPQPSGTVIQSPSETVSSLGTPPDQQTTQGLTLGAFDQLPEPRQRQVLSESGPLSEREYSMEDIKLRVFVKGNWQMLVAYSLKREASALLKIVTDGVEPLVQQLTPGEHKQIVIRIPPEFGLVPRVAKLSITVDSGNGGVDDNAFLLNGMGIVKKTDVRSSPSFPRSNPDVHYFHSDTTPLPRQSAEFPITVEVSPGIISTAKNEKVTYWFTARDKYSGGKALLYLVRIKAGHQTSSLLLEDTYQPVLKDEPTVKHSWKGKNPSTNKFSLGLHRLDVFVWQGEGAGADWFGPVARPIRVE